MGALTFMWWMLFAALVFFGIGGAVSSWYVQSYDFMRRTNVLASLLFGAGRFCLGLAGVSLLIATLK